MKHWLVKSEPTTYSWEQFVADGGTCWDGVRNFQARMYLTAMEKDDRVLFYHSVGGREVVGVARVCREAYRDPTTDDERWIAVDLEPVEPLSNPVSLDLIRRTSSLADIALVRQSRLSVMPLTSAAYRKILELSQKPGTAPRSRCGDARAVGRRGAKETAKKAPAKSRAKKKTDPPRRKA